MDENLIAMTHVCQGWRDVLIGYPLLWTRLNCVDRDKTRVYLKRSKSSPLEVSLHEFVTWNHRVGAFFLVAPHIGRIDSLTVEGGEFLLQNLTKYFSCPTPLLRNLSIDLKCKPPPALSAVLFNGDLSSLYKLSLAGVDSLPPWKKLPKLTAFTLSDVPNEKISATRLLNFFANAPLLNSIELYSIPETSDASPGRVVSLPCLKSIAIYPGLSHSSNLLNHLRIPTGALLHLWMDFGGEDSPLWRVLPETSDNLQNIRYITSVYLNFHSAGFSVLLNGPSGELHMSGSRQDQLTTTLIPLERRILWSLKYFDLSRIQRLAIGSYEFPGFREADSSTTYHVFRTMKDLRTLFLSRCNNSPFILALDPAQTPPDPILCPKLEELILYVGHKETVNPLELVNMAKERSLRGAKLHSIVLASLGKILWEWVVPRLEEHVVRVKRRTWENAPDWDSIPNDSGN